MSGAGSAFPEECKYCVTSLREEVRYPTTTVDKENGDLYIFTFCSKECKEKWLAEYGDEPNRG